MPRPAIYDEIDALRIMEQLDKPVTANTMRNELKKFQPNKYDKIKWSGVNRLLNILVDKDQAKKITMGFSTYFEIKHTGNLRI